MNEKLVQRYLKKWLFRNSHIYIFPNVYAWSWESDLISLTRFGYSYEYEIKLDYHDFVKDFNKHQKHDKLRIGQECPNYFSYVVPSELVLPEDIPEYCGLIYIQEFYQPAIPGTNETYYYEPKYIKKPPRLHSEKVGEDFKMKIGEKAIYRLWDWHEKLYKE